jgi:hypothetical protein
MGGPPSCEVVVSAIGCFARTAQRINGNALASIESRRRKPTPVVEIALDTVLLCQRSAHGWRRSIAALRLRRRAAPALYAALSARNTPEQRAFFDFNAREFLRDPQGTLDPKRNVKLLNQQEVENVCRKLDDVQRRTDRVASAVRADRPYLNPQQFGTAVHTDVAHEINDPRKPDGSPKDSNYRAEVSYWKMAEDGVYGKKDSIRIDVLEDAGRGLVCVYDIKTGQSRRSGLDLGRMREIAENVLGAYPHVKRVIITEVRPRR